VEGIEKRPAMIFSVLSSIFFLILNEPSGKRDCRDQKEKEGNAIGHLQLRGE
jgi:hypothetical protein